jgi:hypothetical protein
MIRVILIYIGCFFFVYGQVSPPVGLNFSAIKDVLKNDMLEDVANKKQTEIEVVVQENQNIEVAKFNIPGGDDFWSFFSEYWLIKNISVLKWDFRKPDYGVEDSFKKLLEKHGHYEIQFKILYIDSPIVFHAALPSSKNSLIFLISVPFVKTLDLSKIEIALLLYENYIRVSNDYFIKKVTTEEIQKYIGSNFLNNKFDTKIIEKILKAYDDVLFVSGFNFQEQFEVTNRMGTILKSDLSEWSIYFKLLEKIDQLVKSNSLYKNYLKIYPSPELQMGWLRPKGQAN